MTLPQPAPLLSDFLTPEQIEALTRRIDMALQHAGRFEITLKFDHMALKYIQTTISEGAPKGTPTLRPQERKPDGI